MKFFHSFTPVFIKYDFLAKNGKLEVSKNWIECRLNVKAAPNSCNNVQITVYPKYYDEMMPYFIINIDYTKIQFRILRSHSKENVHGIMWCDETMRMNRIFIAFESKTVHQKFSKYFRKLLKNFNSYNNCEHVHKVSVCNEAEQMIINNSIDAGTRPLSPSSPSLQIMRVSDASGFEDVILRPKTEQWQQKKQHQRNRRLARPFAVISGLFKSHREYSSSANQNEMRSRHSHKNLQQSDNDNDNIRSKKSKRKSWNIFKSMMKKNRDESPPTFQRFQEPLNVERFSFPVSPIIANDVEWYDLNKEEMSIFEAKVSDIVNQFSKFNQAIGESESTESMIYHYDLSQYLTISSNILWSHNLSISGQLNGNVSNVNLIGANMNKEQIHSSIFIEDECNDDAKSSSALVPTAINAPLMNASFVSTDSNGYAIMHPFLDEPTALIEKCVEPIDDCNNNYNDSSNLSSGFGSDSDGHGSPPQKSIRSSFVNLPATSDFSEAMPSPSLTPLMHKENMQKSISKKRRLQNKTQKLLGMLKNHTPKKSNVTTTPQNKSPSSPLLKSLSPTRSKCTKKLHKEMRPFRGHLLEQTTGMSESSPLPSLHLKQTLYSFNV